MSRQTAAQIIGFGQYLEPDFDPSSLTVSQLLGVLGYHNIRYPTPYTKPKLVQVFNDEIKTRASKLKKERVAKANSIASEDGIMDGHTGKPLSGNKGKAPAITTRRSSRRLSTAPVEDDSSPPRPEPPKRRRSSAQPTLGGSRQKVQATTPFTVVEESEPEEEELPVKKVSRTKKIGSAAKGRRTSHISGGEESGWEENNIFQSGAESSSPARPSPIRPRVPRTSAGPRKSRKSMSAPPHMPDPLSPLRPSRPEDQAPGFPSRSPFQPKLPPLPIFKYPTASRTSVPSVPSPVPKVESVHEDAFEDKYEIDGDGEFELGEERDESGLEDALAVSRQLDADSDVTEVQPLTTPPVRSTSSLWEILARTMAWTVILTTLYATYNYKVESASIGFCNAGTNTSQSLQKLVEERRQLEACQKLRAQSQLNSTSPETNISCPLPPLIPFPHPSSCAPCPAHALCSQFSVTCDTGYLLKPNIFLPIPVDPSPSALTNHRVPQLVGKSLKLVSALTDGLPGLGSVGLPPRCVEDPMRKRHIGKLGKAIEMMLSKERGRRICQGGLSEGSGSQEGPAEAMKWGIETEKVKDYFRQKADPRYRDGFDEVFEQAIQQLTQWGGVFIGENEDGERYVAHKTPDLNWACIVTVKSRELWAAWRSTVIASILTLLMALGIRVRMTRKQKESRRISALVQVVLDTLRNQELAYYTDPLTATQPYLSSIQLRDLVLQDEHSVPTRRRLWEQVERIVESNANIRANLEEIEGGDETRVWRWVGSSGRTPGRKGLELEE